MKNEESNQQLQRKETEQDTDLRVDLAVESTELALERTQLSWIRTTLALYGSGIGLNKGIEAMHNARIVSGNALFENAYVTGITLSIASTVLMVVNTWFYIHRLSSV